MGSLLSRVRLIYQTLKAISDSFSALSTRISRDPGLPLPNPLRSYWCVPPSPLDSATSKEELPLPAYADVVIIGSGISGTAIARTLLKNASAPLRVVMLEARDVCSGATGRNGGHVSPNTYQDYAWLEGSYGPSAAQAILRFRLAHLPALVAVAEEEGLLRESQARTVTQFDVYLQDTLFRRAKDALAGYLRALPEYQGRHTTLEDKAALQLFTHTPCTAISAAGDAYVLTTPKGTIATAHVIHATNAWVSHLLPGMRRTIVPLRSHMSAQRPGRALQASWAGARSFVFYAGTGMVAFDYLTQQAPAPVDQGSKTDRTETEAEAGALMFGGGAMLGGRAEATGMDNIGITDDTQDDFAVTAFLGGALERYFAGGWGAEGGASTEEDGWGAGRMKAAWTGIIGLSADGQPWVGRVEPRAKLENGVDTPGLAPPGEWIAAGFTGEGMTHAWLAGVALAQMVLGAKHAELSDTVEQLPPQFLITEKRWRAADVEAFLGDVTDA
ncbi:hypothetical protein B0H17DRAFT_1247021 [Mycena rosella]|uniref:FAD dependent oxidoreductase domain-containing protein n=1 Tax=Mycena rosella TaxID=1033263 RepID=A0AAD7D1I7_MYCRO|nr:hypothetical protein B0H17DRAFT_1247021 [Mycena rosella]